jgi:NAD(P)-dependent dehydrogenase (short-subunit alcohol dehydrogenase family)
MWIPTLEEISLPDSTPDSRAIAPQLGGVYLITGGLGNIGLAAAQVLVELAGDKPVHLYLTSRTADAIAARWQHFQQTGDHSVPSQLQPLQALTQAGGILHLRQVDVASLETMSQLVSEIMTAHQRLDGVIHAAGIVDPTVFVPLVDLTPDQCELHFQPKVTGLNVLTQVLAPVDVGFCFAISSISSWLGGIGYAAYAAANAYMDAVCRAYARTGKPQWLSIDWDAWEFSEQSFQPSPLLNSLKLSGLHLESGKTILRSLVLAQITNQTKMTGGEIIVSQGALQQRWLDWQSAAQTSICPTNTRSALDAATPQFLQDQSANGESSVATKLTHLWLRVLGVKQVNPSDNFFAQGGTSLLSLQLLSQLRQEFPIDLSLQDFFSQPTFGDVLHQILQADVSSRSAHGQADVIPSVPRQQPLPLSFAQQQLWLLEQMESTQNAYQITEVLHLKGSLNVEVLERSMQAIAMRHEILRTRFVTEGDEPVQVIDSVVHQPIIRVESFVPPEGLDLKDALLPIIDAEFSQPFQLEQGLLWSIRLLVLAPTEFVLLIRLHHIIADDWSIGIFMEELSTFYDSFLEGREPALPELPIQYADYSTWQRQTASKAAWQADLEFWTQQLAELPLTLPAPTDYVRQSARTSRGEYYTNPISAEQVRQLQQLSERLSSSQFMILLSVFKGLLHGLSGKTDIVVGTPLVGRDHLQLTSLIGYFINPAVLRTDLAGDISFTTLVERVQRSTLNAYAHQNLPFERLVSELQVERDPTRHPLFQVWFTLLTYTSERSIHPLLTMEPLYLGLRTVPFDLALILEPHREGLVSHWEYSPDLFERSTIIRLGEGFQFLLTQVLEEPDCTLSHLCHRLQEFDQQIRLRQSQALAEQRQTSFNQIRRRAVSSKQSDE